MGACDALAGPAMRRPVLRCVGRSCDAGAASSGGQWLPPCVQWRRDAGFPAAEQHLATTQAAGSPFAATERVVCFWTSPILDVWRGTAMASGRGGCGSCTNTNCRCRRHSLLYSACVSSTSAGLQCRPSVSDPVCPGTCSSYSTELCGGVRSGSRTGSPLVRELSSWRGQDRRNRVAGTGSVCVLRRPTQCG